jgi:transposase-like protein
VSVTHPGLLSQPGQAVGNDAPYIRNGDRQEYKEWFKARVIEECRAPGPAVSIVARRYNNNTNVLFRWRREYRNPETRARAERR